MDEHFLSNIKQIIEENLDNENFSVEELADKAGLSRSMLHRKVIKLTGKSASDLITETRLLKAKKLLEDNAATASEIAYQVGFNSPSYFTKVFKKHFNVLPGDVRKGHPIKQNALTSSFSRPKHVKNQLNQRRIIISAIAVMLIALIGYFVVFYSSMESLPVERSIAVLPLANLTGQSENDYFVDGMHEAIIGELGRIGSVRVISRTSTLRYNDSDMLLKEIANELGVNTIVEGSVYATEDSLRIILQLIDVFPEEQHLMVNEYEDAIANVLQIHSSAVKDITQKIKIELTQQEEEYFSRPRTVNPEAYKTYLRGMHYAMQGTKESLDKGIELFEDVIKKDPTDPLAYAGLALSYTLSGHFHHESDEAFKRAIACANKALEIDPTINEAYTALSVLNELSIWDWEATRQGFEKALANNPNDAIAHAYFAWYYILFNEEELCLYHAERSVELAPLSATYNCWLAYLYHYYRRYEKAEYRARRSLELMDNIPYGNLVLGWTYIQKGDYQKALELHEKLPMGFGYWEMWLSYSYIKAGKKDKAIDIWTELQEKHAMNQYVDPFSEGMIASYLGYNDKAFELINEAIDKKLFPSNYVIMFPLTEEFRTDTRYFDLLRKLNLPTDKQLFSEVY